MSKRKFQDAAQRLAAVIDLDISHLLHIINCKCVDDQHPDEVANAIAEASMLVEEVGQNAKHEADVELIENYLHNVLLA